MTVAIEGVDVRGHLIERLDERDPRSRIVLPLAWGQARPRVVHQRPAQQRRPDVGTEHEG
jgi:hypothetical protein